MRTGRRLVVAAAACVAFAAAGVYATVMPASAAGPALLPFSVSNSTGRSDAVYLYVLGTNLTTGKLGYVNAAGTFSNWPAGSNPPSAAPDVSIAGPGNGGSVTVNLPKNISGRIYFSMGAKLNFFLTPDGLVQPAPWAAGDTNQNILFDWSEFTYNDSGLWLNSSQVDMFAIPNTVTVTGSAGTQSTGSLVANGRDNVISGLQSAGWGAAVYTRSDGTVLRVLSPGHAALSSTLLDSYISTAWNAYASKTLTVVPFADQPGTQYFGRTSGTTMTFTNSAGTQVASFQKPSSADVWGCAGNLAAPNDQVVGPIARTLCAALNRGTLGTIDTQPSTNAAQFYQNSPTNQYAKLIHANMADGKAYAFPFDDVGNFESLVNDGSPTSAGITLGAFTGGGSTGGTGGTTTGQTIAAPGGKCVDVSGDDTGGDGTAVQLWDCQSAAKDQHWTWSGQTLQTLGRCLDIAGGVNANSTPLQLATCNGGGYQNWVTQADGSLKNPTTGRCVDAPSGATANGTRLQIYDCNGTAAQKYAIGTPIYGPGGKCVDVAGDDTGSDGTAVQLWDCQQTTSTDQKWTWSGQTLHSRGYCLDIAGGVNANGTKLQIATCNGGGYQNWVVNANGSISNPTTGRCIDSPSGATANGTRLEIWDCNGTGAQTFALA